AGFLAVDGDAPLKMSATQEAFGGERQIGGGSGAVYLASVAGRVHGGTAFESSVPGLIVLVEIKGSTRRGDAGRGRRGERKTVAGVEPHRRTIGTKQKFGCSGGGLPAAETPHCALHAAQQ